MGRIYGALDRFLPFDKYLDPMFGGQQPVSAPRLAAMPAQPQVQPGKKVPKVSKLRVLDRVLGGQTITDAYDTEAMRPMAMARMEEEDALARQVFKDDPRGYLAWRANREETGKAMATGVEDYTLAPGAARYRGSEQLARTPTAPQSFSPGQAMVDEKGRELYRAPYKPEITTLSPGESASVIDPNSYTDKLFNALIQQESGGRTDAVGPQTPYGQALGSTQMLPGTAQEMARKLGLPWKPELMTAQGPEAERYQQMLGRAYFDEGLAKYGGNPEMALKYYHGGPDERLWGPKTQAYAAAVLGRVGPRAETVAQGAPKPGYRPATPEEKLAYNLPLEQPAQIGPDGRIDPLGDRLKPVPAQITTAMIGNREAVAKIDRAIAALQSQPGAVGLQNMLPQALMQRLDPNGVDARAGIADIGSLLVHERSGAAVTAAEAPRLQPFIPQVTDTPETARKKLLRLRENVAGELTAMETAYGEDSGYRVMPSRQAPAQPPARPAPPPRKPVQQGSPAPAGGAPKRDPFPGIREGQVVMQGGRRYRRQGSQMIEVR